MSRPTVDERVDALVEASTLLDSFVSAQVRDGVAELARRAARREGLGLDRTVVALAGSTGSGKSSLLNAVSGLALAETGVRRPTTAEPLACVWGERGTGELLDWLGVPERRRVEHRSELDDAPGRLDGLVLLDLPDHDSLVCEHRVEVDRLVGLADTLVWVTDPVKYADALLHEQYLSRLTHHGAVVLVVLNQVDLLSSAEQRACLADLRRLVDRDGLAGVSVLPTSAVSGIGVRELRGRIGDAVQRRHAAADRLAADAAALAARLRSDAGLEGWPPGGHAAGEHRGAVSAEPTHDLCARVQRLLPIDALRAGVAQRHRAFAAEHLQGGSAGAALEPAVVPDVEPAVVPDVVPDALRDHVDEALTCLPPSWRGDARERVDPVVTAIVDDWRTDLATTLTASPQPRQSWGRLRRSRQLVLVAAVAAGVAAVVLLGLVLIGANVPAALWALPVLGAAVAAAGHVTTRARLASEQQDYADDAAGAAEATLRARVDRDVVERLGAALAARCRDCDAAVSALDTAQAD